MTISAKVSTSPVKVSTPMMMPMTPMVAPILRLCSVPFLDAATKPLRSMRVSFLNQLTTMQMTMPRMAE